MLRHQEEDSLASKEQLKHHKASLPGHYSELGRHKFCDLDEDKPSSRRSTGKKASKQQDG